MMEFLLSSDFNTFKIFMVAFSEFNLANSTLSPEEIIKFSFFLDIFSSNISVYDYIQLMEIVSFVDFGDFRFVDIFDNWVTFKQVYDPLAFYFFKMPENINMEDIYLILLQCYHLSLIRSKPNSFFLNFQYLNTEVFLFVCIFLIFTISLLLSSNTVKFIKSNVIYLSILSLVFSLFLFNNTLIYTEITAVHFLSNYFILFIKKVITFIMICVLLLSLNYQNKNVVNYEFTVLLLLVTWSMFLLVSVNDLLGIYLIIELQSFCFYIFTSSKTDSIFSTEAGLKYFILGSLSSGLFLFGISMLYGVTGLTNLTELKWLFMTLGADFFYFDNFLILALLFILISLLFKFGLVPFHMYIPDVYAGTSSLITTLFLVVQKFVILFVYLNVTYSLFLFYQIYINYFIVFSIILSIAVGSLAALGQSNIKRLIAYSAIVNSGFLLIGISVGTLEGIAFSILFLFIYIVLMFTFFTTYLSLVNYSTNSRIIRNFKDLVLLKKNNLVLALVFILTLFSLAGIPPLAGFYGKLFLFNVAIKEQMYLMAILSILFSVITAYYYIYLVKIMFFENQSKFIFLKPVSLINSYIISFGTIMNVLFFCFPDLFLNYINIILLEFFYK